jgi:hypothetical protein
MVAPGQPAAASAARAASSFDGVRQFPAALDLVA